MWFPAWPILRNMGLAVAAAASLGCNAAPAAEPRPASPPPDPAALAPGLAVLYYEGLFRHIDEVKDHMAGRPGEAGPPLNQLKYRVGEGRVLTSQGTDGVAAKIAGLIRLDQAGTYSFVAQSNDGVRVEIGGVQVIEDPDVHSDRYSPIAKLEVAEPGWYPIEVLYFERKSTATLELYWKPPSEASGSMAIVPAEALAHPKGE